MYTKSKNSALKITDMFQFEIGSLKYYTSFPYLPSISTNIRFCIDKKMKTISTLRV